RRHTRSLRDWSSDVCSSDLDATVMQTLASVPAHHTKETELEFWRSIKDGSDPNDFDLYVQQFPSGIYAALAKRRSAKLRGVATEIGRASCRERVGVAEGAVA